MEQACAPGRRHDVGIWSAVLPRSSASPTLLAARGVGGMAWFSGKTGFRDAATTTSTELDQAA